jgi:hypothetical protein
MQLALAVGELQMMDNQSYPSNGRKPLHGRDFLTRRPGDENRRHVHNAIVSGMIEGWTPSRESVTMLIEAAAGNITGDEYRARVIASAKVRDRQSGQLLNTSVPDTVDDPLSDAKEVAREGKPRH